MNYTDANANDTQLDPRMSLYRTQAKEVASGNIKSYGIFSENSVNSQLVNQLLFKYSYIYAPKVCIILRLVIIPSTQRE